jgi:hypothetical protein
MPSDGITPLGALAAAPFFLARMATLLRAAFRARLPPCEKSTYFRNLSACSAGRQDTDACGKSRQPLDLIWQACQKTARLAAGFAGDWT